MMTLRNLVNAHCRHVIYEFWPNNEIHDIQIGNKLFPIGRWYKTRGIYIVELYDGNKTFTLRFDKELIRINT